MQGMKDIVSKLFSIADRVPPAHREDTRWELQLIVAVEGFFWERFWLQEREYDWPSDFRTCISLIGEEDIHLSSGAIFGVKSIFMYTKVFVERDFFMGHSDKEAWLCVGKIGDDDWCFLCCNPQSPHYGQVMAKTDSSPWDRDTRLSPVDGCYTDYLSRIAALT